MLSRNHRKGDPAPVPTLPNPQPWRVESRDDRRYHPALSLSSAWSFHHQPLGRMEIMEVSVDLILLVRPAFSPLLNWWKAQVTRREKQRALDGEHTTET